MTDEQTLAFYDGAAEDYANSFANDKPDADLKAFIALLPQGGRVLDFGCGPGTSAAHLKEAGFEVEATDASRGMANLALKTFGLKVRLEDFTELDDRARFDGVWANFSLLHAARDSVPDILMRLHRALKPGGVLHLGVKLGQAEARDHLGRLYTYFSESELEGLLSAACFTLMSRRHGHGVGMAGTNDPFIIILAHG